MIFLQLFLAFLQVGCFSFGGAYGAIPLIRDVVLSNGWLNESALAYLIAVSESTPGPIMVNLATYIGSTQAGLFGALIATAGVVLPSFVIILILSALMKRFIQNKAVQAVLSGLKPCIIGIILSTGLFMTAGNLLPNLSCFSLDGFDWRALVITILVIGLLFGFKKWKRRDFSPIFTILIAAGLGALFYAF